MKECLAISLYGIIGIAIGVIAWKECEKKDERPIAVFIGLFWLPCLLIYVFLGFISMIGAAFFGRL